MMLSIPIIRKPVEMRTMRKTKPKEGLVMAIIEMTTVMIPIPKSKALDNILSYGEDNLKVPETLPLTNKMIESFQIIK